MYKIWLTFSYYVSKAFKTWMHTWGDYPPPGIAQMWLSRGYYIYQHKCEVCGGTYYSAKEHGKCRRNLRCYLVGQVKYVTRNQPSEHVKLVRPAITHVTAKGIRDKTYKPKSRR